MKYTVTKDGAGCLVTLDGALRAADQGEYKALLSEAMAIGGASVRVDLANVDAIDSTGLGLLLMLNDEAGKAGAKVTLANAHGAAKHAFDLARFDELFTVE